MKKIRRKLSLRIDISADFTTRDLDSDLMLVMLVIGNEIVNFSNMEILCTYTQCVATSSCLSSFILCEENTLTHSKLMSWIQIKLFGMAYLWILAYGPFTMDYHSPVEKSQWSTMNSFLQLRNRHGLNQMSPLQRHCRFSQFW